MAPPIATIIVRDVVRCFSSQHFLYFRPLPQGQGSFRPTFAMGRILHFRGVSCREMGVYLETPRTFMREILGNDFDFLLRMMSDPDVMRYYPRPYGEKDVRDFINRMRIRYREDGCGLWMLLDRESGEPLGRVGLMRQSVNGVDEFEIGYMLHKPFWRRGLATEAALAVRAYAFAERKLPRVVSLIRPDNVPSQGVARKLGMEVVGSSEQMGHDHLIFAVNMPAG
jgi:ribosomal-protein-alanine N-acetyltransferase